jgi:DNA-binding transcriptional MerR regulator
MTPLMTARELAEYFRVSVRTVRGWRRRGHITPAGKRGTATLYEFADAVEAEHKTRNSPNLRGPRSRVIVGN